MGVKSSNYTIVGSNGWSSIMVSDKSIKILTLSKSINPPGVVTVLPGIQLELGRSILEFIGCLKQVRQPLAIQKISESKGVSTYYLIRLQTGKVKEARICTITTYKDMIINVAFNQDLVYDKEFQKYQRLSVVHQLRAGKEGDSNLLTNAITSVSTITGVPQSRLFIIEAKNKIVVKLRDTQSNAIQFVFVKDKEGYYNLLSIGRVI